MWPRLSVLQDPVEVIQQEIGGAHAALVTAVATKAFEQTILMLRQAGTVIFIRKRRAFLLVHVLTSSCIICSLISSARKSNLSSIQATEPW
jgi:D-arabinose 1-dehydrogenase-like Zn-dependent alcohol dehydrogenase